MKRKNGGWEVWFGGRLALSAMISHSKDLDGKLQQRKFWENQEPKVPSQAVGSSRSMLEGRNFSVEMGSGCSSIKGPARGKVLVQKRA